MQTPDSTSLDETRDPALVERLRAAAETLELIASDRGVLASLPEKERHRLLNAAGLVYNPDTAARRQMVKATIRDRKAKRVQRDEKVLHGTGIRSLRRQEVFTTPNFFPPNDFSQQDVADP